MWTFLQRNPKLCRNQKKRLIWVFFILATAWQRVGQHIAAFFGVSAAKSGIKKTHN